MQSGKKVLAELRDNWEGYIAAFFLTLVILCVCSNVFMRYVLNKTSPLLEEVVSIFFIWAMFIGSAGCYRKKMHIGIDLVVSNLPSSAKKHVELFVSFFMLFFIAYLTYLSLVFSISSYSRLTSIMRMPKAYVNIASSFCFSLMTVYAFRDLLKKLGETFPHLAKKCGKGLASI